MVHLSVGIRLTPVPSKQYLTGNDHCCQAAKTSGYSICLSPLKTNVALKGLDDFTTVCILAEDFAVLDGVFIHDLSRLFN